MRKAKKLDHLPDFKKVLERKPKARIKSFSGKHDYVEVMWDLNDKAIADQMFKIKIGKEEAIINREELYHYLRAV